MNETQCSKGPSKRQFGVEDPVSISEDGTGKQDRQRWSEVKVWINSDILQKTWRPRKSYSEVARGEPAAKQDAVEKEPTPAAENEAVPVRNRPQVPMFIEDDPSAACPQGPSSKNIAADSRAINLHLGKCEDGVLEWEPV